MGKKSKSSRRNAVKEDRREQALQRWRDVGYKSVIRHSNTSFGVAVNGAMARMIRELGNRSNPARDAVYDSIDAYIAHTWDSDPDVPTVVARFGSKDRAQAWYRNQVLQWAMEDGDKVNWHTLEVEWVCGKNGVEKTPLVMLSLPDKAAYYEQAALENARASREGK